MTHPSEGLTLASTFGYVAFFALAGAVALGMVTALDDWGQRISSSTAEQLHLALATTGIVATVTHLAAHTVRAVGGYAWWQTLVPFAQGGWIVALGVIGWLGVLALLLTLALRQRLGYRRWARVHLVAYIAALAVAAHVVAASDEVAGLRLAGVAVIAALVAIALLGVRRARGSSDLRAPNLRRDHASAGR